MNKPTYFTTKSEALSYIRMRRAWCKTNNIEQEELEIINSNGRIIVIKKGKQNETTKLETNA